MKNSKVVTISFSPPDLLPRAKERAAAKGFRNSFSAYVCKLIEDDLAQPAHRRDLEVAAKFPRKTE